MDEERGRKRKSGKWKKMSKMRSDRERRNGRVNRIESKGIEEWEWVRWANSEEQFFDVVCVSGKKEEKV